MTGFLSAFLLLICGLVASPAVADEAAPVDGAVADVALPAEAVIATDRFVVTIDWSVPGSAQPGDSFQVQLPRELLHPEAFVITDEGGETVADVSVVDGLATFRLTDYAAIDADVQGRADIEVRLRNPRDVKPGQLPLKFTSGEKVFDTVLNVRAGDGRPSADPVRHGFWNDPEDEGRERPQRAIHWLLESKVGPFSRAVMSDKAGEGWIIDCSTVRVSETDTFDREGRAVDPRPVPNGTSTVTCDDNSIEVRVQRATPRGAIVRVDYEATLTDNSLTEYAGEGTFTFDGGKADKDAFTVTRLKGSGTAAADKAAAENGDAAEDVDSDGGDYGWLLWLTLALLLAAAAYAFGARNGAKRRE